MKDKSDIKLKSDFSAVFSDGISKIKEKEDRLDIVLTDFNLDNDKTG